MPRSGPRFDAYLPYTEDNVARLTQEEFIEGLSPRVVLTDGANEKILYFQCTELQLCALQDRGLDRFGLIARPVAPAQPLRSAFNRFASPDAVANYDPFNSEVATSYFTVDEVRSYSAHIAQLFPDFVQVEAAEYQTWQYRTVDWLRIGLAKAGSPKRTCLILAGTHGNELPGSDAAIALVDRLVKAAACGQDLVAGGARFAAGAIQQLLEQCLIAVVPCVNPDGRADVSNGQAGRRGNLRPGLGVGVDLNRNYDYLWADALKNCDPDSNFYKGPDPISEPEAQNVQLLLEELKPEFLVDIHTPARAILMSWANDVSQSTDEDMNFRNRRYDGMRGGRSDCYSEYLSEEDRADLLAGASKIQSGIGVAFRSPRPYAIMEAAGLPDGGGDSMGLCQDYSFSRHLIPELRRPRTLSYTLELGAANYAPTYFVVTQMLAPSAVAGVLNLLIRQY